MERYLISYFDKKVRKGEVIVGEVYQLYKTIDLEQASLLYEGWYQRANELLEATDKSSWHGYKSMINKWMIEIKVRVDNNDNWGVQAVINKSKSGEKQA